MAMRLLKKEDIAQAQNADKAREISEGLKISRKVDSLRELKVQEEFALEKFRDASLLAIGKEISDLTEKKEKVAAELRDLEEKAKRELSKTDQKRLEDLKKSLEIKQKELTLRKEELDLQEIDVALALKEADGALGRQKTHEETARKLHVESEQERREAAQTLINARKTEENALRVKGETEEVLTLRENGIAEKEREISLKQQENLKISRELEIEKRQLADQRGTLERALERLRKNRLA